LKARSQRRIVLDKDYLPSFTPTEKTLPKIPLSFDLERLLCPLAGDPFALAISRGLAKLRFCLGIDRENSVQDGQV